MLGTRVVFLLYVSELYLERWSHAPPCCTAHKNGSYCSTELIIMTCHVTVTFQSG